MFKTITRLLFGGEEAPQDVKTGEEVDDGWLVVPIQECTSSENQDVLLDDVQRSNFTPHKETSTNMESDSLLDAESTALSSSTTSSRVVSDSLLQPKALTELTQLTCTQKAKAWAGRHHVSRSAIQRQNRVRQGVQHHFHLQQPGHRNLSH